MDQTSTDVNQNSVQVPVVDPQTIVSTEDANKPAPGDKTESALLLKSLQEEREKRRQLEEENEQLKSSTLTEGESDEGKAILSEVKKLQIELAEVKQDKNKAEIISANPILKDKWTEFEEFRTNPDNKGMNLKTAAKAYLIENGLFDKPRTGLEKPTGGTKQPLTTNLTNDQIADLRKNNFRQYQDMLMKGLIKVE